MLYLLSCDILEKTIDCEIFHWAEKHLQGKHPNVVYLYKERLHSRN